MNSRLFRRRKRAVSDIIGAVILFAMIFSIGFGLFYFVGQDQQFYQQAQKSNAAFISQQNSEHLLVYGTSNGGNLGFYVNNTGISATIVSFWIFNGSSSTIVQYKNATTLPGTLPYYLGQSQSWNYPNTGLLVTSQSQRYTIKVATARGTIAIGTYPSNQITSAAVNSLVAGGFGSLQMAFSSFTWYDYTSGPPNQDPNTGNVNLCANGAQCNGGSWVVDMSHPHPGSLVPEGFCPGGCSRNNYYEIPLVFSVNITNDDPNLGNIVLNSESNLWITETCDFGSTEGNCPNGNPVYVFYAMNMNPGTGAVQSVNQGSFAQISIPYGVSKTIYYGSAFDLSLGSYANLELASFNGNQQQTSYYGQFAVFLLFSGTKITPQAISVYGQNIPFESTNAVDNLGWYSETPMTCTAGQSTPFALNVTNSAFSVTGSGSSGIKQVQVNASAFTSITATKPTNWNTPTVSNGIITWTPSSSSYNIKAGSYLVFSWKGTPPAGSSGQQLILPLSMTWGNGQVTQLSAAEACNVS